MDLNQFHNQIYIYHIHVMMDVAAFGNRLMHKKLLCDAIVVKLKRITNRLTCSYKDGIINNFFVKSVQSILRNLRWKRESFASFLIKTAVFIVVLQKTSLVEGRSNRKITPFRHINT
jgi:hypothetical protein